MNRRVLSGILIAVLGIGLIAGGIFAINGILRQSFAPPAQVTAEPLLTEPVVVAARDLPVGSVINNEDVQVIQVPVGAIPRNAIRDVNATLGRIAAVYLVEGEMILSHHLADPTNVSHDIGYIIGDNQVLLAFPASDLMSSLNILQRGDVVDILVSIDQVVVIPEVNPLGTPIPGGEETTESRLFTFDAQQRITISAIVTEVINDQRSTAGTTLETGAPAPTPTPSPAELTVRAYLLALNPQDALVLKHLQDAGAKFDIVLRSPTSNELFLLNPITSEYLIERYELEITR